MVKPALEGLPGVKQAHVSFEEKEAVVVYDPDQVTVEQMMAAVANVGFRASPRQ
ncbi:MAG: cation transporter [Candidatus Entotheonellia bacterium]